MKNTFGFLSKTLAASACILSLSACSSIDSRTAGYTVGGAAVGLGVGTLVSITAAGCIPCGAAVGTAIGAGVGLAYDQTTKH